MLQFTFPAVFELDYGEDGDIGVWFPDLPGCITVGDNFRHAISQAKEVMELHLKGMVINKDPIPTPTPEADIECGQTQKIVAISGEVDENVKREKTPEELAAILATLEEEEQKPSSAVVTIPDGLMRQIQASGLDLQGFVLGALDFWFNCQPRPHSEVEVKKSSLCETVQ
ncbi:MAG: type II toxin-antitoxin system HicB family antitoxin [Planctomycetia bacterium]|nr:type II toxin-antitoxin system HicB family antitoxin [Planctomycetia bacterium]